MPRIKVTINKANTKRLIDFVKKLKKENPTYGTWDGEDKDEFYLKWFSLMKDEIRSIRDCHEKDIIVAYVDEATRIAKFLTTNTPESLFYATKKGARSYLVKQYTNKSFDNNIDRYFNEVKKQYIEHPQNECDSLEFSKENRDVFLKNNLKLVVNCAKRYLNLGLPLDDLIQAGNEGLIAAFERFDPSKANLRNDIKKKIKEECEEGESIAHEKAENIIKEAFTYDKLLDETLKKLPQDGFDSPQEFCNWVDKNVKTAVFASVAFQWIRASILSEVTKRGTVISIPNKNALSSVVRLDSVNPYTDDCYTDNELSKASNDEFIVEDNKIYDEEKREMLSEAVDQILSVLTPSGRRMMKKRYGIGLPYSMTVTELAENEGVSLSTVKSTLKEATAKLIETITPEKKEILMNMINN